MVQSPIANPLGADPAGKQGASDGWVFGAADHGPPIPEQRDAPFPLLPSDKKGIAPLQALALPSFGDFPQIRILRMGGGDLDGVATAKNCHILPRSSPKEITAASATGTADGPQSIGGDGPVAVTPAIDQQHIHWYRLIGIGQVLDG